MGMNLAQHAVYLVLPDRDLTEIHLWYAKKIIKVELVTSIFCNSNQLKVELTGRSRTSLSVSSSVHRGLFIHHRSLYPAQAEF